MLHTPKIFTYSALSLLLMACDNGNTTTDNTVNNAITGNTNSITQRISGTAATGKPMVGTVFIMGSQGNTLNQVIQEKGFYQFSDVSALTPPFILKADDNGGTVEYSYAEKANITANITQLTSLALFTAYKQQDLPTLFDQWQIKYVESDITKITEANTRIYNKFKNKFEQFSVGPAYNFFTEAFTPNNTSIDAVLDLLQVKIEGSTATLDGTSIIFDQEITDDLKTVIGDVKNDLTGVLDTETIKSTLEDNKAQADNLKETIQDIPNDVLNQVNDAIDGNAMTDGVAKAVPVPSGNWTLTVTGNTVFNGFNTAIPAIRFTDFPAPEIKDVREQITKNYNGIDGNIEVTNITDTETNKVFNIVFSGTQAGIVLQYHLTYDYVKQ